MLNQTYPAKKGLVKHFFHFTATYDKKDACDVWCSDYNLLYGDNGLAELFELIKQAAADEGLIVSLKYIFIITANTVKKPENILIR